MLLESSGRLPGRASAFLCRRRSGKLEPVGRGQQPPSLEPFLARRGEVPPSPSASLRRVLPGLKEQLILPATPPALRGKDGGGRGRGAKREQGEPRRTLRGRQLIDSFHRTGSPCGGEEATEEAVQREDPRQCCLCYRWNAAGPLGWALS